MQHVACIYTKRLHCGSAGTGTPADLAQVALAAVIRRTRQPGVVLHAADLAAAVAAWEHTQNSQVKYIRRHASDSADLKDAPCIGVTSLGVSVLRVGPSQAHLSVL